MENIDIMHIPDGFLSKEVFAPLIAVSAAGIAVASGRTRKKLDDRQIPLMGVMAAFVFAAQMVNFPVAAGTSGHFMGAALITILFGPSVSVLVISTILIVQALVFQDGGVTALGANIFNMAIAGSFTAGFIHSVFRKFSANLAIFLGSFFSIVVAAVLCAVELGFSGTAPLKLSVTAMTSVHSVIGIFEGLLTVLTIGFIKKLERGQR